MRAVDRVIEALDEHGGPTSSWLVGEPCTAPPEELREALAAASRTATFGYPPQAGVPRLREILAANHSGATAAPSPDRVVITHGAKGGLLAVLASLLEPGDELIHPLPCYPAYPAMASLLGARPVPVAEGHGSFDGWPQAVADHLGPRTRAVVLSSPSNPTGATLSEGQTRALVGLCHDRGVRLICDEAYGEFHHQGDHGCSPAALDPDNRTVVQVRSVSKSWALCGWRLGWVIADTALARRVAARHASLLNPASGPAQEALTALPLVNQDYLEHARAAVRDRIERLAMTLEESGQEVRRPDGGFYLWLDVADRVGADGTADYCVSLARQHGVGLWPGDDFGGPGHVRIAATAPPSEDWTSAVEALRKAFS